MPKQNSDPNRLDLFYLLLISTSHPIGLRLLLHVVNVLPRFTFFSILPSFDVFTLLTIVSLTFSHLGLPIPVLDG